MTTLMLRNESTQKIETFEIIDLTTIKDEDQNEYFSLQVDKYPVPEIKMLSMDNYQVVYIR